MVGAEKEGPPAFWEWVLGIGPHGYWEPTCYCGGCPPHTGQSECEFVGGLSESEVSYGIQWVSLGLWQAV